MKPLARLFDTVTDHNCQGTPHTNNIIVDGSDNVFGNGRNIAQEGSLVICEDTLSVGSSTVFINGKSASMLGDITTKHEGLCDPAFISSASENIFLN